MELWIVRRSTSSFPRTVIVPTVVRQFGATRSSTVARRSAALTAMLVSTWASAYPRSHISSWNRIRIVSSTTRFSGSPARRIESFRTRRSSISVLSYSTRSAPMMVGGPSVMSKVTRTWPGRRTVTEVSTVASR